MNLITRLFRRHPRRVSPQSEAVLAKVSAARRQLAATDAKLARTRTRTRR